MTEADVRRILHSRGAAIIASLLAVTAALVSYRSGCLPVPPESHGLVKPWSGVWNIGQPAGIMAGVLLSLATAWLLSYVNKIFNLVRSLTMLHSSMFLLMQAATPALLVYLCQGSILCLAVAVGMLVLMSVYADPDSAPRRVFLTQAIISGCTAFDFCAVLYIPVFLLACVQLRIFTLRTLSASLLGIATPWIILLGLGIVGTDSLQLPMLVFNPFANTADFPFEIAGTALLTGFIAVAAWVQNIFKVLTYNAQSRAYLSLVTVVTLVTLAASAVDFQDIYSFLPLLNACAALQLGHLFGAVYQVPRSYIPILVISMIYIAVFVCQTVFLF